LKSSDEEEIRRFQIKVEKHKMMGEYIQEAMAKRVTVKEEVLYLLVEKTGLINEREWRQVWKDMNISERVQNITYIFLMGVIRVRNKYGQNIYDTVKMCRQMEDDEPYRKTE
jgi:predicted nucleic acid-binding protein